VSFDISTRFKNHATNQLKKSVAPGFDPAGYEIAEANWNPS